MSWIGSQANIFEKQKVREIASLIRDTDRHGKAHIMDTTEGEEPDEMLKVEKKTKKFDGSQAVRFRPIQTIHVIYIIFRLVIIT